MTTFDSASLDTLSDSDAVSLLFDLTSDGEQTGDKLQRIDAEVYQRLMQAYGGDEMPLLHKLAL